MNPHRPYRFSHIVASDAAAEAVREDVCSIKAMILIAICF